MDRTAKSPKPPSIKFRNEGAPAHTPAALQVRPGDHSGAALLRVEVARLVTVVTTAATLRAASLHVHGDLRGKRSSTLARH